MPKTRFKTTTVEKAKIAASKARAKRKRVKADARLSRRKGRT